MDGLTQLVGKRAHGHPVLSVDLRGICRLISRAEQTGHRFRFAWTGADDADAAGNLQPAAGVHRRDGFSDCLGAFSGITWQTGLKEHHELIAPVVIEGGVRAHGATYGDGDILEAAVSREVAQNVVD